MTLMLEKKHLVIIGHGSQSQTWNKAVFSFCDEMKNHLTCSGPFSDISLCFLEHGKPSIPDHLHVVCDTTHDDILAIPLFLTVTQHVQHDIPKEIEKMAAYRCCVDGKRVYEHNGRAITLAPPPASYELLAENIVNRFIRYEITGLGGIGRKCKRTCFFVLTGLADRVCVLRRSCGFLSRPPGQAHEGNASMRRANSIDSRIALCWRHSDIRHPQSHRTIGAPKQNLLQK